MLYRGKNLHGESRKSLCKCSGDAMGGVSNGDFANHGGWFLEVVSILPKVVTAKAKFSCLKQFVPEHF